MGTVYEAENLALGRSVAVKILHPSQVRKKDAVKRFHQEARSAGAIGHPNICEVYDFGTLDDGSPYLVMEKLVGETLSDRIASEGGLAFDDVIDVLTQVLSGLVAAHERGVIHRDIKPENIFLTRRVGCSPVAKILDFGVSKMIHPVLSGEREEDLDLTRAGMVMGTPYYMSPEQARGDRNLDARVDLWACGIILYEALTGRRPFQAANYNALLMQILTRDPRPARDLRPALPFAFDAVILKAMARSRDDRYTSATDFQQDLQSLRDRHPPGGNLNARVDRRVSAPNVSPEPPRSSRGEVGTPNEMENANEKRVRVRRDLAQPLPRARASEVRRRDTPSSVEIPITFSSDTPRSAEPFSAKMAGALGLRDRGAIDRMRESPALRIDDDETQVSTLASMLEGHRFHSDATIADPPRRAQSSPDRNNLPQGGSSAPSTAFSRGNDAADAAFAGPLRPFGASELAEARALLIRDTIRQDPPQFAPPPRPSVPQVVAPPGARSPSVPSVPVKPLSTPRPKSVPPPPPPPLPPSQQRFAAGISDDDDDNDRTLLFRGAFPKRAAKISEPAASADDTAKMDGDLEERLREARERISSSQLPHEDLPPDVLPRRKDPRR
jgi:serine/threonine protein kinase